MHTDRGVQDARERSRPSHKEERQDVATGPTEQDASRAVTQGRPRPEGSPKGQGPESEALTAIGLLARKIQETYTILGPGYALLF